LSYLYFLKFFHIFRDLDIGPNWIKSSNLWIFFFIIFTIHIVRGSIGWIFVTRQFDEMERIHFTMSILYFVQVLNTNIKFKDRRCIGLLANLSKESMHVHGVIINECIKWWCLEHFMHNQSNSNLGCIIKVLWLSSNFPFFFFCFLAVKGYIYIYIYIYFI
jgi:hypothetical protein